MANWRQIEATLARQAEILTTQVECSVYNLIRGNKDDKTVEIYFLIKNKSKTMSTFVNAFIFGIYLPVLIRS